MEKLDSIQPSHEGYPKMSDKIKPVSHYDEHGRFHKYEKIPCKNEPFAGKNYTEQWTLDGKLHREDGPARIWFNGWEEWCQNGEWYREGGLPTVTNQFDELYRNGDNVVVNILNN